MPSDIVRGDSSSVQSSGNIGALRQRRLIGDGTWQVLASPPTRTRGVANAASTITNVVKASAGDKGAFTFRGPKSVIGLDVNGYMSFANTLQSSQVPWAIEFITDAPLFDIILGGNITPAYRLVVDQYDGLGPRLVAAAPYADPGTSSLYRDLYDWSGVRKLRHYRIECESTFRFGGVDLGPQDSIHPPSEEDATIIIGDSFSEPTIQDTDATNRFYGDGWVSIFGRALGLRNCYPSAKGGTGYLNPGTGVTVRSRFLNDVVAQNPARLFFACGLNDANREPTYTAQMEYDECVTLFTLAKQQLPSAEMGVFSPMASGPPSASLYAFGDAIKAAATVCSLPYYDLFGMTAVPNRITASLTATTTASSTISVSASIPAGSWIRVGGSSGGWGVTPNVTSFVKTTGVSGTGPYSLSLATAVAAGIPSGAPVVSTGLPWVAGSTGRQGATANTPRDLLIGGDSTHPTIYGHQVLGRAGVKAYMTTVPF